MLEATGAPSIAHAVPLFWGAASAWDFPEGGQPAAGQTTAPYSVRMGCSAGQGVPGATQSGSGPASTERPPRRGGEYKGDESV